MCILVYVRVYVYTHICLQAIQITSRTKIPNMVCQSFCRPCLDSNDNTLGVCISASDLAVSA